ncbi:unnamed protein product [Timema podura]|uniref:Uncharacterized protein n=1 Tax=Timema podura TaxID=61482 RepID=A0ABN7NVB3_TIMPD|nr:unnamed protein product [Timema podura]
MVEEVNLKGKLGVCLAVLSKIRAKKWIRTYLHLLVNFLVKRALSPDRGGLLNLQQSPVVAQIHPPGKVGGNTGIKSCLSDSIEASSINVSTMTIYLQFHIIAAIAIFHLQCGQADIYENQ